jgi:hypothetical protein
VVVCGILAALCVIAAFSSPGMLVAAVAFGGYGYHLYNGGRELIGKMADGRTRARAWIVWALIAAIAVSAGFSSPACFVIALGAAGYAFHLFRGGRDLVRERNDGTTRSAIWLYYAVIALIAAALGLKHPATLVVVLPAGAYSVYLFRGGRWVLWIW